MDSIKRDLNTGILTMNKLWIEHSHNDAIAFQEDRLVNKDRTARLDIMGLFETCWMIYPHDISIIDYGYPGHE